jgi:hypothetical protein
MLQISSVSLIPFNCFEQTFEITGSKSRKVVSLNDLNEYGWTIHEWLPSIKSKLGQTLVKSCNRYPPSSKSIKIFNFFNMSRSSFSTIPDLLSLNDIFS